MLNVTSKSVKRTHLFIVLFLLAVSGFPSFLSFKPYVPILLPLIIYEILQEKKTIPSRTIYILVCLFLFSLLHLLAGNFTLIGALSFFLTMSTILYAGILLKDSFSSVYIKIMRTLSYVAVIVWVGLLIMPGLHSILVDIASNIPQLMSDEWLEKTTNKGVSFYIYYLPLEVSTSYVNFIRNCGPFFEPGLFASYLSLALLINISYNRDLFDRSNLILIVAILTTCSSAGYITFALIVLFSIFYSDNRWKKILLIIIVILLWRPVSNLTFMSEKIFANYEVSTMSSSSRFGAVIYHFEKIAESPFIGYAGGTLPVTDFDRVLGRFASENLLSPNGLSFVFVFWGIPLAILFYYFLFQGLKTQLSFQVRGWKLAFAYMILLSTAFSQTVTTEMLYLLIASFLLNRKYE